MPNDGTETAEVDRKLTNNLPITPFLSKMARLNLECADAALQANCSPGQKWRCIYEDGQWRKQKCKFHVSSHFHNILEEHEILIDENFFFLRLNYRIIWPN